MTDTAPPPSPRPAEPPHRPDRRLLWVAAAAAAAGLLIAIVALVLAIDARNANNADVKVTDAVRQQARAAVADVQAQLQRDIGNANGVLLRLRASSAAARQARESLQAEATANRSGIAIDTGDIQRLQSSIDTLNGQVTTLTVTVNGLAASQRALAARVRTLEEQSASTGSP